MMKKIHRSAIVPVLAVLLIWGGMFIHAGMNVYGQSQQQLPQQQQQTPPLSTNQTSEEWMTSFNLESCDFASTGENSYFILKPGFQAILEGDESGEELQLTMTVLNETKVVDGIETRVLEERETEGGNLVEVSRNYFAICKPTNNAIYFGEDVDMYEDGEIVSHEGAWLAGQDGAKAGMIMPGDTSEGMRYYQEIAPGVAEDRAEIVSVNGVLNTPAGNFENVLETEETNPLKPGEKESKFYAPGIGLIREDVLKLVEYTQAGL
jgi:hypothetical protein